MPNGLRSCTSQGGSSAVCQVHPLPPSPATLLRPTRGWAFPLGLQFQKWLKISHPITPKSPSFLPPQMHVNMETLRTSSKPPCFIFCSPRLRSQLLCSFQSSCPRRRGDAKASLQRGEDEGWGSQALKEDSRSITQAGAGEVPSGLSSLPPVAAGFGERTAHLQHPMALMAERAVGLAPAWSSCVTAPAYSNTWWAPNRSPRLQATYFTRWDFLHLLIRS